jgi:hypothetical protein
MLKETGLADQLKVVGVWSMWEKGIRGRQQ